MILDIRPHVDPYGDCFDNLISTLAHWKNTECTLMHTEAWGFTFEQCGVATIGERIYAFKGNSYNILQECYSISVEFQRFSDTETVYRYIRKKFPAGIR